MARQVTKSLESKARILASAGRGFRRKGFGGLGIDGLAKDAGVTSGAFYAHFESKAEAFRLSVEAGMTDLRDAVAAMRRNAGDAWLNQFIDFYVTVRRTCDIGESCALQNLAGEVERAGDDVRQTFEHVLREVIDQVADGLLLEGDERRATAIAMLSILSGGISLARAVSDPVLSKDIAETTRATAQAIAQGRMPAGPNQKG